MRDASLRTKCAFASLTWASSVSATCWLFKPPSRFICHMLARDSWLIAWRWAFSSAAVKLVGGSLAGARGSSSGLKSGPSNWISSARTPFPFFRGGWLRFRRNSGAFWGIGRTLARHGHLFCTLFSYFFPWWELLWESFFSLRLFASLHLGVY